MDVRKEKAYIGILNLDRVIAPLWHKSLERVGVSFVQSEVLFLLETEEASVGSLSRKLCVTSSAVTQTVEALERKKLVQRKHTSADRRIVSVVLSSSGKDCLRILLSDRRRLIDSLLDDFSKKELTQLITLHKKMTDSVKA